MILLIPQRLLKIASIPALALAALSAGCGYGVGPTGAAAPSIAAPGPGPSESQVWAVAIDNFSFNPPSLTVPAGTTVTWVNHDDVPHTVTANDKGFDSKALDTDQRFTHVFKAPGTYSYYCQVHPHMTGQIIVK